EKSTAHESPIQSWNRTRPSVVSASKSGAVLPICSATVPVWTDMLDPPPRLPIAAGLVRAGLESGPGNTVLHVRHREHRAREHGEYPHDRDRGGDSEAIGRGPGQPRTHRIAEVAPSTVNADGRRPPGRFGVIRHGSQEGRVDERGPQPIGDQTAGPG